jgi:hypothetical protein
LSVVCRLGRSLSLQWVWAFVGDVGCFLGFYKKTSREGQKKGTLKKQPTNRHSPLIPVPEWVLMAETAADKQPTIADTADKRGSHGSSPVAR